MPCTVKSGSRGHGKESHCYALEEYRCLLAWITFKLPKANSDSGASYQGRCNSGLSFAFWHNYRSPKEPLCYYEINLCRQRSSSLLFLAGNVQAIALRDIFTQARNRDSFPMMLHQEEPEWEKRRSVNLSELIDIYR